MLKPTVRPKLTPSRATLAETPKPAFRTVPPPPRPKLQKPSIVQSLLAASVWQSEEEEEPLDIEETTQRQPPKVLIQKPLPASARLVPQKPPKAPPPVLFRVGSVTVASRPPPPGPQEPRHPPPPCLLKSKTIVGKSAPTTRGTPVEARPSLLVPRLAARSAVSVAPLRAPLTKANRVTPGLRRLGVGNQNGAEELALAAGIWDDAEEEALAGEIWDDADEEALAAENWEEGEEEAHWEEAEEEALAEEMWDDADEEALAAENWEEAEEEFQAVENWDDAEDDEAEVAEPVASVYERLSSRPRIGRQLAPRPRSSDAQPLLRAEALDRQAPERNGTPSRPRALKGSVFSSKKVDRPAKLSLRGSIAGALKGSIAGAMETTDSGDEALVSSTAKRSAEGNQSDQLAKRRAIARGSPRMLGSIGRSMLAGARAANSLKKKKKTEIVEKRDGELLIAFRGDSILQFRSPNKSKKLFKNQLDSVLPPLYGPCTTDIIPLAGGKVKDVRQFIESGGDVDVLCVAIGINDLMTKDQMSVVPVFPEGLDAELAKLAEAMISKADRTLILVGGPGFIWDYPDRWDEYIEHIYEFMVEQGVNVVPPQVAADVMYEMPLQDGLHFANSEEAKTLFAKAWASWLETYAGMERKD